MSESEQVKINWERALHDVRHIVCKHLSLTDLKTMEEVNKSWCAAALRESSTRFYIQQLRYPDKVIYPWTSNYRIVYERNCLSYVYLVYKYFSFVSGSSKDKASSLLLVKPSVSLLICSKVEKYKSHKSTFKEIHAMMLKVTQCLTAEDVEGEGTGSCDMLGLFFPSIEQRARVRMTWSRSMDKLDSVALNVYRIAEDLGLNEDECTKSTLLWFITPHSKTAARLPREIEKMFFNSFENDTVVWTGELENLTTVTNDLSCEKHRFTKQDIIGLRISGSCVESWTETINLRLPKESVEAKLHALKKKVKLRRYCTALLSGPCSSDYGNNREIMRNVKRIFPNIPFVGLFNDHAFSIRMKDLPEESLHLNSSQVEYDLEAYQYISLIIITYD